MQGVEKSVVKHRDQKVMIFWSCYEARLPGKETLFKELLSGLGKQGERKIKDNMVVHITDWMKINSERLLLATDNRIE